MFSDEANIWLALKSRLDDIGTLTALTSVSWPNEPFTAPSSGYLRVSHVPNTPIRPFHASDAPHERLGIVQVMVMAKRGWSEAVIREIAGKIAAHFPPDQAMRYDNVTVKVTRAPRVGAVLNPEDSAYAECPVEIQYRCFA